jgi:hypothetical protein
VPEHVDPRLAGLRLHPLDQRVEAGVDVVDALVEGRERVVLEHVDEALRKPVLVSRICCDPNCAPDPDPPWTKITGVTLSGSSLSGLFFAAAPGAATDAASPATTISAPSRHRHALLIALLRGPCNACDE